MDHLLEAEPCRSGVTKKAMYAWDSMHFDKGRAGREDLLEDLMKTADVKEGVNAFLEKRRRSGREVEVHV